jgi:hypothetical protein
MTVRSQQRTCQMSQSQTPQKQEYLLSPSLTSWNYAVHGTLTRTQGRIQASEHQMGPAMMAMSTSYAVIPSGASCAQEHEGFKGTESTGPTGTPGIDEVKGFNVMHSCAGVSVDETCFHVAWGGIGEGRSWTRSLCSTSTILMKLERICCSHHTL